MLLKPSRILWPTDFSELSLQAAAYARAFRQAFGARLHVIHVLPPPLTPDVSVMLPAEVPAAAAEPELLEANRTGLKKLVEAQFGSAGDVEMEVFYGNSWVGICDYAKAHEIDLIVISTHGRTGLSRVLIGSTAERVVQHAPCPVLAVKQDCRHFVTA